MKRRNSAVGLKNLTFQRAIRSKKRSVFFKNYIFIKHVTVTIYIYIYIYILYIYILYICGVRCVCVCERCNCYSRRKYTR